MQSNKYLKKAVNICRLKIYHSKNVKPSHFSNTSVFQTYTSSESDTSENHCYIHRPGALKRKLDTSADESNVPEVNARMFHDGHEAPSKCVKDVEDVSNRCQPHKKQRVDSCNEEMKVVDSSWSQSGAGNKELMSEQSMPIGEKAFLHSVKEGKNSLSSVVANSFSISICEEHDFLSSTQIQPCGLFIPMDTNHLSSITINQTLIPYKSPQHQSTSSMQHVQPFSSFPNQSDNVKKSMMPVVTEEPKMHETILSSQSRHTSLHGKWILYSCLECLYMLCFHLPLHTCLSLYTISQYIYVT